jgi:endo-1,4-beta-xylanase
LAERVTAATDPKVELERLLAEHIQTVLAHFRGRVHQWDVVNEPLDFIKPEWDDSIFYRTLGPDFIAKAFTLAHAADPTLELVLNEQLGNYEDEHAEKFFEIVKHLRETGVPIHGVGLQSHVIIGVPNLDSLATYMGRFAELGLFVEITELDARLREFNESDDPYAAQGRFFHQLTTNCVEQPACRGITVWGISDRFTWLNEFPPFKYMRPNDPLLFDHEMRRKPAYLGMVEALGKAGNAGRAPLP